VAIGLAAVLLVAVGAIFKTTSDTVGTGYALSDASRSIRSLQTALYGDLVGNDPTGATTGIVPSTGQPFLLIHSEQVAASLNAIDKNNGNSEIYRTDILSFFSQGSFLRQTGQTGDGFISDMAPMTNAYIWYGHVNQLDNGLVNSYAPGSAPVPNNNSYADTFCLGRIAVPMAQPLYNGSNGYNIWDSSSSNAQIFANENAPVGVNKVVDLSPFAYNSNVSNGYNGASSMGTFFASSSVAGNASPREYYDLAAYPYLTGYPGTLGGYRSKVKAIETSTNLSYDANWWMRLLYNNGTTVNNVVHRFDAYPFTVGQTPASMSMLTPRLQEGCTQFIVEYAGDFVQQNANGDVVQAGQDGQIDYVVEANGVKHIRWYGFPRNTHGGATSMVVQNKPTAAQTEAGSMVDVFPLADVAGAAMPFEKERPTIAGAVPTTGSNYAGIDANSHYTCAFGPVEFDNYNAPATPAPLWPGSVKPALIRILVTVTDKNNRLPGGVTQEYIFKVP